MYNIVFNCRTESFSPLFECLVWFMGDLGQRLLRDSYTNSGFPELTCSMLRDMISNKNKACSLLAHKLRDSGGHAQRAQSIPALWGNYGSEDKWPWYLSRLQDVSGPHQSWKIAWVTVTGGFSSLTVWLPLHPLWKWQDFYIEKSTYCI